MLTEGREAPAIELENSAGGAWSLSNALRNGPVLLAFFKVSCPTCQLTLPFLQRMVDAAGPGAEQVFAVSQDDAAATAQFQKRFRVPMPVLLDRGRAYAASNAFGITSVPSLFLIEPDGRISLAVAGFSRVHLERLGQRFGVAPFRHGEKVPNLQPG